MKKHDLLQSIAERSYDVGFGAKKHFATFDIIEKIPGWIGFLSISFGIFSLAYTNLPSQFMSAIFVVLGVVSLYVSFYVQQKQEYEGAGKALTKLFYELKTLYLTVKGLQETDDFTDVKDTLSDIENRFFPNCISKQILFSNWLAHYKFFWELQIGWLDEQLHFGFVRDKVPLSLWLIVLITILSSIIWRLEFFSWICSGTA
jgi:hypothetical protein